MSFHNKETIKCPKCGQMQDITVWTAITANDSPDLKEDILKRKINIFVCDICGAQALMPSPVLYSDSEKKLMISFSPCQEDAEKARLLEHMQKASKQSEELNNFKGYNLRFVTDYNELIEKILIFDCNMNDKVIEFIKLMILSQEPERAAYRTVKFGKLENNSIEFLVQDKKDGQFYTSSVPVETYKEVEKQIYATGVKPYSFNWELVDVNYASMLLNGFNNPLI